MKHRHTRREGREGEKDRKQKLATTHSHNNNNININIQHHQGSLAWTGTVRTTGFFVHEPKCVTSSCLVAKPCFCVSSEI